MIHCGYMPILEEIRRRARGAIFPVICAAVIGYFGYHIVEGDRGLKAYARLSSEIVRAQGVYADLSDERRALEKRVSLLRVDALDLDILDEQARRALGSIGKDDVVIIPAK